MKVRPDRADAERIKREGVLAAHARGKPRGSLDPRTLARSYNLSVARVTEILQRNGG